MNSAELIREVMRKAREVDLDCKVPGHGNINSHIAVVGEHPGEREVKQRMPFVGGSGGLLWAALKNIHIGRNDVYSTNVVKRQVQLPSKYSKSTPISNSEKDYWKHILLWELSQLPNLKFVILLGNAALEAVTGNKGIMSWRGSVIDVQVGERTVRCICCYNPAFVLREPKQEITFRFDIGKVALVTAGKYVKPDIHAIINPTAQEACEWIDDMQYGKLPVSIDIETGANETSCIGLTNKVDEGMCIPFRTLRDNFYTRDEEIVVRKRAQKLFSDKSVQFVAQNGVFDHAWLWYKDRLRLHGVWFDTLLAHHTLYSQLPHNLGFLTAQYTFHPYYKDDKDTWREGGNIDQFWEYNVKDICITLQVQKKIREELRQAGLEDFFFSHVMRLQPHLVRMEVGGVLADRELKDQLADDIGADVAALANDFHSQVHELTGDDEYFPNPNSWPQLQELFFKRLKLVGRGVSTNAANRERIKNHPRTSEEARNMLITLDKYKEEHKFLTTYAESKLDRDDRFRCEYRQFGTQSAPGRLSSSQTPWGTGMNLQNQPYRSQPMFVADEGYGFGYFDLAQAEARVVGWLAGIDKWKEDFERARLNPGTFDCHVSLASDMWDIPYEDVPTSDYDADGRHTLRFTAKRCRHGLNYRMQAPRLAETTGLSLRAANDAFRRYHSTSPEVKRWWGDTEKAIKTTRTLTNPYGRRLIILERLTDDALESIVAFVPQSTIGDKVTRVMYLCEDDDRWPSDARIVLNIHDALICLAPLHKVRTCLAIMKEHAEEPLIIKGEQLIIPADLKESQPDENGIHRWAKMKEVIL